MFSFSFIQKVKFSEEPVNILLIANLSFSFIEYKFKYCKL